MTEVAQLRQEARAVRRSFVATLNPVVRRALARAMWQLVQPHLLEPVAGYRAMADEIAADMDDDLLWPRVVGPDQPLAFHKGPAHGLVPGYRTIAEPPADWPQERPATLLVPLLAVDPAGNRIGQGGGFYDRTIADLRCQGPLLAIGLCWDVQLLPHVPARPWDAPLDAIATPARFHWCRHGVMPGT